MQKRVGLLAGLLVLVLGSGAVAQSSDWEAMGGTVVDGGPQSYPDKGFTIAFPDDWLVVEFDDDPPQPGLFLFADDGTGYVGCLVYETWPWPDGLSAEPAGDAPERLASHMGDSLEASGGYADTSMDVVDLPAGRVVRSDLVDHGFSLDSFNYYTNFTYFRESGWVVMLGCMSRLDLTDDWLPIAESFEFLPAAPEPPPTDDRPPPERGVGLSPRQHTRGLVRREARMG